MRYLVATTWVILICFLGYLPEQDDFYLIFILFGALFGLYITTYRVFKSHHDVLFFVFIAIVVRLLLVFAFPNLSDDVYRFLWDGHLINDGINPFQYTPTEWLNNLTTKESIYHLIYPHLNSKDYYSIYPPVCQGIFAFSTKMSPDSIFWASALMKLFILTAETTTIYFLLKLVQLMRIPQHRVLLYALNPLVILEFSGNLHFEAIMIMFLVMAFWFYMRQRSKMFSLSMAFAIGVKLLPLMFLPFFIRRFRLKKLLVGFLLMSATVILLFMPFINSTLIGHFSTSINLYFQKFEFNASVYYVLRHFGYGLKGYNMIHSIGPLLSALTFVSILLLAFLERPKKMQHLYKVLLYAFSIYLFLSTTIHPWYLGIPIVLSVLTHFRYPIFWSFLIIGTYINYSYDPYHENLWVVLLEYLAVYAILITEVFKIPLVKILFSYLLKGFRFLFSKS